MTTEQLLPMMKTEMQLAGLFIFLFFKGKKVDLEVRFLSKLQRNPSS